MCRRQTSLEGYPVGIHSRPRLTPRFVRQTFEKTFGFQVVGRGDLLDLRLQLFDHLIGGQLHSAVILTAQRPFTLGAVLINFFQRLPTFIERRIGQSPRPVNLTGIRTDLIFIERLRCACLGIANLSFGSCPRSAFGGTIFPVHSPRVKIGAGPLLVVVHLPAAHLGIIEGRL